jgi:RNA polymerase sigma-32 factor
MTGMTGRRRALPNPPAGNAATAPDAPIDEMPSGTVVGELVESENDAHRVSKAEVSSLSAYMQALRRHPVLTREEEHELAVSYVRTHELAPARKLVTANLRLVVKIAQEYRRAHRNLLDLIQEGNVGLIQAVQRYDPFRGVKLSTYAAWWIRAYILKFILANWRIVRVGTTQAQRRLFFNLRRERERMERMGLETDSRRLATALDVNESDVIEMERRLAASEMSLDAPVQTEGLAGRTQGDMVAAGPATRPDLQVENGEFQELLRSKLETFGASLQDRELHIFRHRLLADRPTTLEQIGSDHGVSRERARQIEERLKKKLRVYLETELGDSLGEVPAADRPGSSS